eukprot:3756611-Pyramimonas_sp.AAC.1
MTMTITMPAMPFSLSLPRGSCEEPPGAADRSARVVGSSGLLPVGPEACNGPLQRPTLATHQTTPTRPE